MSSLGAAAERRPAPEWARALRAGVLAAAGRRLRRRDPSAALLAGGLVLVAFLTTGGTDLAPNTWTQIVLVLAGMGTVTLAALRAPRGRLYGGGALLAFAALAALTLASVTWSVEPSDSWLEANRTLSYLAVFAGAVAVARIMPGRWSSVVLAVAGAATLLCGYALLVKVFPVMLDRQASLARLQAPFTYFNAVGLMAAMGIAPVLWAGTQERGGAWRALAVPALTVLMTTLVLSYSRGALLAALAGLAVWFVAVPQRLRGAALLGLSALGAALAAGWALHTRPITADHISLAARVSAGHAFGLLLILLLGLASAAGAVVIFTLDRRSLSAPRRRAVGIILLVGVAMVPLAGLGALAASSRGFSGEVSHLWQQATDSSGGVGDQAGRLGQVSNSRGRYWSEGLKIGEHNPLVGAGALGFATAQPRYAKDSYTARHAHSYPIETFADLGLVGLALNAVLLVAWGQAARRVLRRREPPAGTTTPRDRERGGLFTLLAVVVVFGVHNLVDWTWFVPGVALPALVCAGWLAGRGSREGEPKTLSWPRRSTAVGVTCAATVLALALAWTAWQPLRAAQAQSTALAELAHGRVAAARTSEYTAIARNPLSAEPLWDLAVIETAAGAPQQAHAALVRAVRLQPANPQSWLQLAEYDLGARRPHEALAVLQAALYLGPHLQQTLGDVVQAKAAIGARAAAHP